MSLGFLLINAFVSQQQICLDKDNMGIFCICSIIELTYGNNILYLIN